MAHTVVDPGSIPLASIKRYGDPDLETALADQGIVPSSAMFRLIDVSLVDLEDVQWLPGTYPREVRMIEALEAGEAVPPVVIVANDRHESSSGAPFRLLDGLNRTHAHWSLQRSTIRAYELIAFECQ